MRFVVDHCVPAEVARWLTSQKHDAWTAYEAELDDAEDGDLIAYAHAKRAVLVTTNRDCAQLGRRLRSASVIWLAVVEVDARDAMARGLGWLDDFKLPPGRVLRVTKVADPKLLSPRPM